MDEMRLPQNVKKEGVIAYIDGYNLYFGLKEGGFNRFLWLDVHALVSKILKPNQELIKVKYFTTLVTNNVAKRLRQKTYLNALQSNEMIEIHYGKFQKEKIHCYVCGNDYQAECEKMTDVNIATELMCDFYEDRFDMAMVISGDTDLIPPIKFINNSKNKRAFVAFPPSRVNDEVRKFSKGNWTIGRKNLADSQLPDIVTNVIEENFERPAKWV